MLVMLVTPAAQANIENMYVCLFLQEELRLQLPLQRERAILEGSGFQGRCVLSPFLLKIPNHTSSRPFCMMQQYQRLPADSDKHAADSSDILPRKNLGPSRLQLKHSIP